MPCHAIINESLLTSKYVCRVHEENGVHSQMTCIKCNVFMIELHQYYNYTKSNFMILPNENLILPNKNLILPNKNLIYRNDLTTTNNITKNNLYTNGSP